MHKFNNTFSITTKAGKLTFDLDACNVILPSYLNDYPEWTADLLREYRYEFMDQKTLTEMANKIDLFYTLHETIKRNALGTALYYCPYSLEDIVPIRATKYEFNPNKLKRHVSIQNLCNRHM